MVQEVQDTPLAWVGAVLTVLLPGIPLAWKMASHFQAERDARLAAAAKEEKRQEKKSAAAREKQAAIRRAKERGLEERQERESRLNAEREEQRRRVLAAQ